MGAACFKTSYAEEAHKQCEVDLKLAKKKKRSEIKLLLLGAGDSGKSTIAKQMKIIHKQQWSEEEELGYREIVQDNILSAMLSIIYGTNKYNYTLSAEATEASTQLTSAFPQRSQRDPSLINENIIEKLKFLWADNSIQQIFQNYATKLQLPSSTLYFMSAMDRVFQPNYTPTIDDILRARRSTTGVFVTEFETHGVNFKCVDVGGQRTERRKWLPCFDDVTAVLFCVALDEYDLRMYEDETVWRIHESLQLFNEIANSTHLSGAAIILFMNKKDLFAEKIKEVDLTVTFPEYAYGQDFDKAAEYITIQFVSLMRQRDRLYTHLTCATDTSNISFVFNAIKDMLLTKMLSETL